MVGAVGEVHVGGARRSVHDLGACGHPTGRRVAPGIVGSQIRLGLHYETRRHRPAHRAADQHAEKTGCDLTRVAIEEAGRKQLTLASEATRRLWRAAGRRGHRAGPGRRNHERSVSSGWALRHISGTTQPRRAFATP